MSVAVHHYRDRIEAGQMLARSLAHYASRVDSLVLALTRGAVPIASEVAAYLRAPLDAFVALPIPGGGADGRPLGAVVSGGVRVLDHDAVTRSGLAPEQVDALAERASAELQDQERLYRGRRPPPHLNDRVVIVVDEGITTGFLQHAAVIALHRQQPAWLVVAAPVGSPDACEELAQEVHEVVCPVRPEPFDSIGLWYEHFSPVADEEAREYLRRAGTLPSI